MKLKLNESFNSTKKRVNELNKRSNEYFRDPGCVKQCTKAHRSGILSSHYIDFDNMTIDPFKAEDIVLLYSYKINEIIEKHPVDFLAFIEKADGGTTGTLKMSIAISIKTKIPNISLRMGKELAREKLKMPYDMNSRKGLKYILITDHISSGQEVLKSIKVIEENGGKVTDLITYTSESHIDVEEIETIGINFHTIKTDLDLKSVGISFEPIAIVA